MATIKPFCAVKANCKLTNTNASVELAPNKLLYEVLNGLGECKQYFTIFHHNIYKTQHRCHVPLCRSRDRFRVLLYGAGLREPFL